MKYCPNCGYELPSEAAFCPNCGYKIEASLDDETLQTSAKDQEEAAAQGVKAAEDKPSTQGASSSDEVTQDGTSAASQTESKKQTSGAELSGSELVGQAKKLIKEEAEETAAETERTLSHYLDYFKYTLAHPLQVFQMPENSFGYLNIVLLIILTAAPQLVLLSRVKGLIISQTEGLVRGFFGTFDSGGGMYGDAMAGMNEVFHSMAVRFMILSVVSYGALFLISYFYSKIVLKEMDSLPVYATRLGGLMSGSIALLLVTTLLCFLLPFEMYKWIVILLTLPFFSFLVAFNYYLFSHERQLRISTYYAMLGGNLLNIISLSLISYMLVMQQLQQIMELINLY